MPENLARGLAVFLNTSAVDEIFQAVQRHTQVNATDLRLMKYPSRAALSVLGKWAKQCTVPTQDLIDEQVDNIAA